MRALLSLLCAVTWVACFGVRTSARKAEPTLESTLAITGAYLHTYARRVSGMTLEEQYTIVDVSTGRMKPPVRVSSDVVLLDLSGDVIALRDAYAIDNAPLRERQSRIPALLATPTEESWQQAQAYARESVRHMGAEIIARLNEPTAALQFISARNRARVDYRLDGRRRSAGVETVAIRFEEKKSREQRYILETRGRATGSGRFWVDPLSGTIHQTELWMQSDTETARLTVSYARDAATDLWIPARTTETYDTSESPNESTNMGVGSYNVRRSFQCAATYSNARLTPIELAVVK